MIANIKFNGRVFWRSLATAYINMLLQAFTVLAGFHSLAFASSAQTSAQEGDWPLPW